MRGIARWAALVSLVGVLGLGTGGCVLVAREMIARGVQVRTGEEQFADAEIDVRFTKKMEKLNSALLHKVNVDVWQGRVLLTGVVREKSVRDALGRLAREVDQARAVYNEIRVVPGINKEAWRNETPEPDAQRLKDFWIETKLKAQLFTTEGVESPNYHLRSVLGNVYLIGLSRSREERNLVIRIVRDTGGVKKIREYIEVKPKEQLIFSGGS